MKPLDFRGRVLPIPDESRLMGADLILDPGYNVQPAPGAYLWGAPFGLNTTTPLYKGTVQLCRVAPAQPGIPAAVGSLLIKRVLGTVYELGPGFSFTSLCTAEFYPTTLTTQWSESGYPIFTGGATTGQINTLPASAGTIGTATELYTTVPTGAALSLQSSVAGVSLLESTISGSLGVFATNLQPVVAAYGLCVAQYNPQLSQWDTPDPLVNNTDVNWLWLQGDAYYQPALPSAFVSRRISFTLTRPIIIGPGQSLNFVIRLGAGTVNYITFIQCYGKLLP